jgi:hypothetical protein
LVVKRPLAKVALALLVSSPVAVAEPAEQPGSSAPGATELPTGSFGEVSAGGVALNGRWASSTAAGAGAGFERERFHLGARVAASLERPQILLDDAVPAGYEFDPSFVDKPVLWVQLSAGYAVVARNDFTVSAAAAFLRTDSPAYGSAVGLLVPFVGRIRQKLTLIWLGLEVGVFGAFGGYAVGSCSDTTLSDCDFGQQREFSLPFSLGYSLSALVGVEFETAPH